MIRGMLNFAQTVDDATTEAVEPATSFLLMGTPMWVTLASALIALASLGVTVYVTRHNLILSAPQLDLQMHPKQELDGRIRVQVTNMGKTDALQVRLQWDADPLYLRMVESSWTCDRLRFGESFTGEFIADPFNTNGDSIAVASQFAALSQSDGRKPLGIASYRPQTSLTTKNVRVRLPKAETLFVELSQLKQEAQQAELRAEEARQAALLAPNSPENG